MQLQHILHRLRQRRCRCLRTRIRRSCRGLLRCRELPLRGRHGRLLQVNDLTSLCEDTKKTDTFNKILSDRQGEQLSTPLNPQLLDYMRQECISNSPVTAS